MTNKDIHAAIEKSIASFSQLTDAKNQIIINQLKAIDDKVTAQNGNVAEAFNRLRKLESENYAREMNCPHRLTIEELKKSAIEASAIKKYIRNWVIGATAVINILLQIITHYWQ